MDRKCVCVCGGGGGGGVKTDPLQTVFVTLAGSYTAGE